MKHIVKAVEPKKFSDWKTAHLDESQTAYGEFFTMIEYLNANHLL